MLGSAFMYIWCWVLLRGETGECLILSLEALSGVVNCSLWVLGMECGRREEGKKREGCIKDSCWLERSSTTAEHNVQFLGRGHSTDP